MAVFNSLTFDGENSLDYGVYITGEAVYNAPERAVEMISIPGRNGAIALDQGRFENIEVTYPAGTFGDDQPEFASKIRAFRNALASRFNYVKLTDSYHPDEYRLGLYKSGLTTTPVQRSKAGEFPIVFNCKPQRFLTSGETEVDASEWSGAQSESGAIVEIDNSEGELGIKSLVADIDLIQSGTGTPSPTNIRPISGRTEVKTYVSDDNLISARENWYANANGVIEASAMYGAVVFPVQAGKTYSLLIERNVNPNRVYAFYEDYPQVGSVSYNSSRVTQAPTTLTAPINGWCLYRDLVANTIQSVVKGSTAESAEEATAYTTALGRTVYKGTLDVASGLLTVTHLGVDMGSLTWTYVSGTYFRSSAITGANVVANGQGTAICDSYNRFNGTLSAFYATDSTIYVCSSNVSAIPYICVRDTRYTDASTFTTAVNGVKVVYELATPQTYQLTPEEVDLLLGTNNLWADSGDITVQYGNSPVYNPTEFDAKPLIKVVGTGTLRVGDTTVTITGTAGQTIYIDCDSMEIYKLNGGAPQSAASLVSFSGNDFPKLKAGSNTVALGTGITSVTITPRWWII